MTIDRKPSGTAKAGLTTGIIGTSLGALNLMGNAGGVIGGLVNNGCGARMGACGCSEDHLVDRYTMDLKFQIAEKDSMIALRDANTYSDQKDIELYKDLNGRLRELEAQLCAQKVENQKTADSFQIVSERMQCCCDKLEARICCEEKERKCADNSIVNYVNSTFYAKQVGTVSTTTPNTAQILYNPLPSTGNNCC